MADSTRKPASKSTASKSTASKSTASKSTTSKSTTSKSAAKSTTARTPAKSTSKSTAAGRTSPKLAPAPRAKRDVLGSKATRRPSRAAVRDKAAPRPRPALHVVPDPAHGEPTPAAATKNPFESKLPFDLPVDPALLVQGLVGLLRAAGTSAGLSGDDLERRVAGALAFVRRRLTGDYTIDDFGFDEEFTREIWLPLLRPLYKRWFRVEVRGIENVPAEGRALVVANHSGTVPVDGLMAQVAIHDEHPNHRFVRMLGADLVFQSPFVGELSRKSGTTLAANADAERLLEGDELVAVFPEGFKGVGKPFSDRYRLQRFGRGGFVSAAVRSGAPIIPCSIVGAEEIYPMLGNAKSIARLFGFPYFPITPTFPLFGLLGAIPLPSKWIIEFGAPIETAHYGAAAADDPSVLFDVTDQVRETIQQTLYSLLLERRSVFF